MRKLLTLLALLWAFFAQAQPAALQVIYYVKDVPGLQAYSGQATRMHVTSLNEDYVMCADCTVDGTTVLTGYGGRKWRKFMPSASGLWVSDIYRKAGTDSVFKKISNAWVFAYRDSTGGGVFTLRNPNTTGEILLRTLSQDEAIVKRIVAGSNVTLTSTDSTVTIAATGSGSTLTTDFGLLTAGSVIKVDSAAITTLRRHRQGMDSLLSIYYTKTNLQTSGQAAVHWNNITNKPTIISTEADPVWSAAVGNYYTKLNLQTAGQASVNWANISNPPTFISAETDPLSWGKTGITTLTGNVTITGGNNYVRFSGTRVQAATGTSVTAANNMTLGSDGNTFPVNGSTQINAISTGNWQSGSTINLIFSGSPLVKNNTTGAAGTAPILLAGGQDWTAGIGDVLTLLYDGTTWHETTRKVAGVNGSRGTVTTVSVVTANGLNGTVANASTTPAISIGTTVAGMLKGNNGAIVAATPGTDYVTSETDPSWTLAAPNYYTKSNLQTSGQGAVHWGNITNAPTFLTTEADPVWSAAATNYYTKTNLSTGGQATVAWANITGAPSFTSQNWANTNLTFTGDREHNATNYGSNIINLNQWSTYTKRFGTQQGYSYILQQPGQINMEAASNQAYPQHNVGLLAFGDNDNAGQPYTKVYAGNRTTSNVNTIRNHNMTVFPDSISFSNNGLSTMVFRVRGIANSTATSMIYYSPTTGDFTYGAVPSISSSRFGFSGEDATASTARSFNTNGNSFTIGTNTTGVYSSFTLSNGATALATGDATNYAQVQTSGSGATTGNVAALKVNTSTQGTRQVTVTEDGITLNIGTSGFLKAPSLANATTAYTVYYDPATNNLSYADAPTGTGGSGSGTVNTGSQYRLAYYGATGTAVSPLSSITGDMVLISDVNGLPSASTVTAAALNYLDATSSIQTQLNSKLSAEADPVVKAISGLVKSNGTTISAAVAGTDYVATEADPTVKSLNGVVIGNAGSAPTAIAGTANQLLRRNAANTGFEFFTPAYITAETDPSALKTASNLSDLTNRQTALNNLAATSLTGTSGQYLRSNGTNVTVSGIQAADVPVLNQNTTGSAATVSGSNVITNTNLRQSAATSVIGNSTGLTANVGDISATADGQYLVRRSGGLIFGSIQASDIPTLNQNTTGSAASFTGSLAGDVTGAQGSTTVARLNGQSLAALGTGLLKNTTGTGVPSIAVPGIDYVASVGASANYGVQNDLLQTVSGLNVLDAAMGKALSDSATARVGRATALAATCTPSVDTLFSKIVANGAAASRYYGFPIITKGNGSRYLLGYVDGAIHGTDGHAVYRISDDYGQTWGAPITIESDGTTNYRNCVISNMGDQLLMTYWTEGGVVYYRTSTDNGTTWSARTTITTGYTAATENKAVLFKGKWVMPIYTFSPSPDRSGVSVSTNNGSTWTTALIPSATGETLSESGLVVKGDSLIAFIRSDNRQDTLYRSASFDGLTWSNPKPVQATQMWSGRPAVHALADGRIVLNYRAYTVGQTPAYTGKVAVSTDGGLSFTTVYSQAIDGQFMYGSMEYVGGETFINAWAYDAADAGAVTRANVKQEYWHIPECVLTMGGNNINPPAYNPLWFLQRANTQSIAVDVLDKPTGTPPATGFDVSGMTLRPYSATATIAGVVNTTTQTFAGDKTFQGIAKLNGGVLNGGTSILRVENSGSSAPTGSSGVGLEFYKYNNQGWISAYNRTTPGYAPIVLYGSFIGVNNTNPSEVLDVTGNIRASGNVSGTWNGTAIADAKIASSANWNTAYTDRNKWDGGSTGLVAATGRTSLGGTTVGQNLFTAVNPSAVTFLKVNADNTVSFVDAASFRTAIGADDFTLRNSLSVSSTQLMWNKATNESVIRAVKSANGNMTITQPDDSTVLFTVSAGSFTAGNKTGTGEVVLTDITGSAANAKRIKGGTNVTVSSDANEITINASASSVTVDSVATLGDITSANARHFLFVGSKRDFYFHAGDSLVQITKTMVALPPPAATGPTGTASTFTLATGTQDFAQSTVGSDVVYNTQLDWARNVGTNTIPAATNGRLMAQYKGTENMQAMLALSINSTRDMADVASSGNFWCYVYDAGSGVIKLYGDYENYTNATPSGSRPTMQVGDWYGLYRDGTTGNVKLQYWRSVANGGTGNWVDVQTFTATTTALMYRKISAYGTSSVTRRITNPKYQ